MRRKSTSSSPATAEVFVSYRRDDSAGHAGRLFDHLARLFPGRVFLDTDTIELGVDYTEKIEQAMSSCRVFIAVIGRNWLTVKDAAGKRRLDSPGDVLGLELERALERDDIEVIPVLVQDAPMPDKEDLPPHLGKLSNINAFELSDDRRWTDEVEPLIKKIEKVLGEARYRTPRWLDILGNVAGPGTAVFLGMLSRLPLFGIPSLIPFQIRDLLVFSSAAVMGLSAAWVELYGAGQLSRSAVRKRLIHALMATVVWLGLVWFADLRDELTTTVHIPHRVTVLIGPSPWPPPHRCDCPEASDLEQCIREDMDKDRIERCWGPFAKEGRLFLAACLIVSVGFGGFVGLVSTQLKAKAGPLLR